MRKFYRFWKKDLLNKLIVLVALLIAAAVSVDLVLLMKPTASGGTLLEDLFPTPTTEPKVRMTHAAETVANQAAMATASVPPTMTTMPFTPAPRTATSAPMLAVPSSTATMPARTQPATPTGAIAASLTSTQTLSSTTGIGCIPTSPAQTGKVLDILDGYTVKVLIDGLVYTVRYLGIVLPDDEDFAGRASTFNGDLVFGEEVSLIADDPDKDNMGRLLRYVIVDETFVNLALIEQGLATAQTTGPLFFCRDAFNIAEQSAREAKTGIWSTAPQP